MGDHNIEDEVNQDGENRLRSINTNVIAFVSFTNSTDRLVDVIWINFTGQRQSYTQDGLRPGARLDMRTFKGHPWITRDKKTGDMLEFVDRGAGRSVYLPAAWDGNRNYRAPVIKITVPVYSLYERSLQVVRNLLPNKDDVEELEIPKQIKYDLGHVKDIIPQQL